MAFALKLQRSSQGSAQHHKLCLFGVDTAFFCYYFQTSITAAGSSSVQDWSSRPLVQDSDMLLRLFRVSELPHSCLKNISFAPVCKGSRALPTSSRSLEFTVPWCWHRYKQEEAPWWQHSSLAAQVTWASMSSADAALSTVGSQCWLLPASVSKSLQPEIRAGLEIWGGKGEKYGGGHP